MINFLTNYKNEKQNAYYLNKILNYNLKFITFFHFFTLNYIYKLFLFFSKKTLVTEELNSNFNLNIILISKQFLQNLIRNFKNYKLFFLFFENFLNLLKNNNLKKAYKLFLLKNIFNIKIFFNKNNLYLLQFFLQNFNLNKNISELNYNLNLIIIIILNQNFIFNLLIIILKLLNLKIQRNFKF